MTAEDTIEQVQEICETEDASHPVPHSLSPSSMGTFTSCPLAFRFGYIERLPEPPSAPASKGTLVHLALQYLMWRPPAQRTRPAREPAARSSRTRPCSSTFRTGLALREDIGGQAAAVDDVARPLRSDVDDT